MHNSIARRLGPIVVCFAFMILAFATGDSEGEDDDSAAIESNGSSSTQSPRSTFAAGDRVVLGDYAYTIHGHRTTRSIGDPDLFGAAAPQGATFLIVEYTIENLTNETQTVLADDFKLIDAQGRAFSSSSDATTALLSESGQDFILSELQPGIPKKTQTAFLVPNVATEGDLRVRIPEKGIFSSGEATVRLTLP